MTENPPMAVGKCHQLGNLRFEHQLNGRWSVGDDMLGVSGFRTPIGAYLALRKWRRDGAARRPYDPDATA